jgi:hypothetical protein
MTPREQISSLEQECKDPCEGKKHYLYRGYKEQAQRNLRPPGSFKFFLIFAFFVFVYFFIFRAA